MKQEGLMLRYLRVIRFTNNKGRIQSSFISFVVVPLTENHHVRLINIVSRSVNMKVGWDIPFMTLGRPITIRTVR